VQTSVVEKGFGSRPIATIRLALGPSSESLQGRNPREVTCRARALYGARADRAACALPRERVRSLAHGGIFLQRKTRIGIVADIEQTFPFNRSYRLAIVLSIPTACSQSARGNSGRSAIYCESPSYTQFRKRSPALYPAAGDQCGTLPNA
jgi:hypothetical protein